MKTDRILTDRTESSTKKSSNIHRGDSVFRFLYLTNTVQGNTQLTRFHGLHRKKKLKVKPKTATLNLSLLHVSKKVYTSNWFVLTSFFFLFKSSVFTIKFGFSERRSAVEERWRTKQESLYSFSFFFRGKFDSYWFCSPLNSH